MENARTLTENLAALLRREHDALAEFLVTLAEFDRRRLWGELGHASLFYFLHRELKLSKAAAQYRKVAAELIQEVPAVVAPLRDGQLCLNSIIEVAKVVTAENWKTVLPRFYGLSRREAEEVVAELQPHPAPPVRTVITTVHVRASPAVPAPAPDLTPASDALSLMVSSSHEPARSPCGDAPSSPRSEVEPLSADLRRIHVTVSKEFARKLRAAGDARPDLSTEQLLEAGLDLLLAKAAKAKGLVERPQKKVRPSKDESRILAHVKREVMERSGGRCEWPLASGERCGSTHGIEFHHVDARAKGGGATADKIMATCRGHNLLGARIDFGDEVMDRYTGPAARKRRPRRGDVRER
jgi:hypothetical protein